MVDATVARGGTSVDIALHTTQSGTPLISTDVGKPNLQVYKTGDINPRFNDFWSGLKQYNLAGRVTYSQAITLADLIKENADGTNLTLDVSLGEYDSNITVAPAAGVEEALTLSYPPGYRDVVDVSLALTRIGSLEGSYTQPASTPTAAGSGPIQISHEGTTVNLERDISVSRSIGRPQSTVRRVPSSFGKYPNYYDTHKTAYDAFELSLEFTQSNVTKVSNLADIFSRSLGRTGVTLDFQGVFGLGSFQTVPVGSGALRHQRPAGQQGVNIVPTINLRRVQEVS